jgi:CubicO group peptidase (beta-lactamase class C family)
MTEWFPMTDEKFKQMSKFLEEQGLDPEWKKLADALPKGTRLQGYHALTGGMYLSQLISRADPEHRRMGKFLRDEITKPLGIDLYVADLQEAHRHRISPIHVTPTWKLFTYELPKMFLPKPIFELLYREKLVGMDFGDMMKNKIFVGSIGAYRFERTETNFDLTSHNHPLITQVESPASSGFANAASLAKVAALMANRGEFQGVRLLKEETFEKANKLFDAQMDLVMPVKLQYTQGGWGRISPTLKTVGWGGAGGSFIQWDPEIKLAAGYVMNFYETELLGKRGFELVRIAHQCAEKLNSK